ncbi:uncharacterized protein LOC100181612 isoform X2 [Ciona intestinalis]
MNRIVFLILLIFSLLLLHLVNGQVENCGARDLSLLEPGRTCKKACTAHADCTGPSKDCWCDGSCGLSCFNKAATCDLPPEIPNVNRRVEGTAYNDFITLTCADGYVKLNGSDSRSCRSDKKWSGTQVHCQRACPPGPNTRNATPTTFETGYVVGHQLPYACSIGYAPVDPAVILQLTCLANFSWSQPQFQCLIGRCSELQNSTSTQITLPSREYGVRARYICNTGYQPQNTVRTRLCDQNAAGQFVWGAEPQCTIVTCNTPTAPTNGRVDKRTAQPYNTVATYTCNAGYKLADVASSTRTCGADGQWGETPVCIVSQDCEFEIPARRTCSYTNVGWVREGSGSGTYNGIPGSFMKAVGTASLTSAPISSSGCLNFHYRVVSHAAGTTFSVTSSTGASLWDAVLSNSAWTSIRVRVNVAAVRFIFKVQSLAGANIQLDGVKLLPLASCPAVATTTTTESPTTQATTTTPAPTTTSSTTTTEPAVITTPKPADNLKWFIIALGSGFAVAIVGFLLLLLVLYCVHGKESPNKDVSFNEELKPFNIDVENSPIVVGKNDVTNNDDVIKDDDVTNNDDVIKDDDVTSPPSVSIA